MNQLVKYFLIFSGLAMLISTLIVVLIIIIVFLTVPCSFERCLNETKATAIPIGNYNPGYFNKTQILNTNELKKYTTPVIKCKLGYTGEDCDECGLNYFTPNLRIIGGIEANPHSWPSMALIKFSYEQTFFIPKENVNVKFTFGGLCGATLIDKYTILTAAHCVSRVVYFTYNDVDYKGYVEPNRLYPTIESMYTVYLGLHDISTLKNKNIDPAKKFSVAKIIIHERYDETNNLNDISIFKLSNKVSLNEYIQLACLPSNLSGNFPKSNNDAYSAGWGVTQIDGDASKILNNVKLKVLNGSDCRSVLRNYQKNWNSQICAGYLSGNKDTCQGDSGGPLFVIGNFNGKNKYILSGIVSYGEGCGLAGKPGIYTRVSYYLDWIYSNK